jgi:hypothetical protein
MSWFLKGWFYSSELFEIKFRGQSSTSAFLFEILVSNYLVQLDCHQCCTAAVSPNIHLVVTKLPVLA